MRADQCATASGFGQPVDAERVDYEFRRPARQPLIGSSVDDVQNQDVGSVKDVIVKRDGKVSAVIVDVGEFLGMGGKNVAVAMNDLKTTNNRLTLNRTKPQLQLAPTYALTNDNVNKRQQ